MSDRSDYEHSCPNHGPAFDCGVVQALRERIKELEAELAEEIFVSDAAEKRIAELEAGEIIYQIWRSTDSCGEFWAWDDVSEAEYAECNNKSKRKLRLLGGGDE